MADDFHFAHFREMFNLVADVVRAQGGLGIHGGHVERRQLVSSFPRRTLLEEQRFILRDMRTDFLNHQT